MLYLKCKCILLFVTTGWARRKHDLPILECSPSVYVRQNKGDDLIKFAPLFSHRFSLEARRVYDEVKKMCQHEQDIDIKVNVSPQVSCQVSWSSLRTMAEEVIDIMGVEKCRASTGYFRNSSIGKRE